MRWLGLVVLLGCTETGAHLTLSAPEGPTAVASYRVVLATPEQVPSVGNQRVAPNRFEVQTVSYYIQRTIAGGTHEAIDDANGFALRIEPESSLGETQFIPFVLLYDASGAVIGVATFHAKDSQMPSPIVVVRDEIDKYTLDVEPVAQASEDAPFAAGQARVVTCFDQRQESFTSGVAWRPKSGGELRLLFPDDGGLDATARPLDLDCDGHAVTAESSAADCDDTRGQFHRDASELCDGVDTNCDGLQSLVVQCPLTNPGTNICPDPTTNTGIALCNDRTGVQGTCQSDPQCLCANGFSGCTKCVIENQLGSSSTTIRPCQPSIGALYPGSQCTDLAKCTVELLGVHGGWLAEVSNESLVFGTKATGVSAKFYVKAKRPEGPGVEITGSRGTSTGEVDVMITAANGAQQLMAIDLRFDTDGTVQACDGSGPYTMYCSQF